MKNFKAKLRAHYCRARVFEKDERGEHSIPSGFRWMRVRSNPAIPDNHPMFR